MKSTLWDKTQAVAWLIYLMFKHCFDMEKIQLELNRIKEDLDQKLSILNNGGYVITWDIFQTNCFWFEPKTLCKQPDGNGACYKEKDCPVLGRLKRV